MSVDFMGSACKESARTDSVFGLCDDERGDKAYSDVDDDTKWVAKVINSNRAAVIFSAIDNCITVLKNGTKDHKDHVLKEPVFSPLHVAHGGRDDISFTISRKIPSFSQSGGVKPARSTSRGANSDVQKLSGRNFAEEPMRGCCPAGKRVTVSRGFPARDGAAIPGLSAA